MFTDHVGFDAFANGLEALERRSDQHHDDARPDVIRPIPGQQRRRHAATRSFWTALRTIGAFEQRHRTLQAATSATRRPAASAFCPTAGGTSDAAAGMPQANLPPPPTGTDSYGPNGPAEQMVNSEWFIRS
jgi:hypothetical protein